MPIHEYVCQDCGTQFEKLVRNGDQPECPRCHSVALAKQLSVFATAGSEGEGWGDRLSLEAAIRAVNHRRKNRATSPQE